MVSWMVDVESHVTDYEFTLSSLSGAEEYEIINISKLLGNEYQFQDLIPGEVYKVSMKSVSQFSESDRKTSASAESNFQRTGSIFLLFVCKFLILKLIQQTSV